jgi:hypothetical protein
MKANDALHLLAWIAREDPDASIKLALPPSVVQQHSEDDPNTNFEAECDPANAPAHHVGSQFMIDGSQCYQWLENGRVRSFVVPDRELQTLYQGCSEEFDRVENIVEQIIENDYQHNYEAMLIATTQILTIMQAIPMTLIDDAPWQSRADALFVLLNIINLAQYRGGPKFAHYMPIVAKPETEAEFVGGSFEDIVSRMSEHGVILAANKPFLAGQIVLQHLQKVHRVLFQMYEEFVALDAAINVLESFVRPDFENSPEWWEKAGI